MTTRLTEFLKAIKYSGKYLAQVELTIFVDNARGDGDAYPVSILTPLPVAGLEWTNTDYTLTVANGHVLSPQGQSNRIDITSASTPAVNVVTFQMLLNGAVLAGSDGTPFIVALSGSGPPVIRHAGDALAVPPIEPNNWSMTQGARYDLHIGNEADATPPLPEGHQWLRSRIDDLDVTLVKAPVFQGKPGSKRSHFS